MCGDSAEVRVQVRFHATGCGPQQHSHGRDCLCRGRLSPEECRRRAMAIWTLIDQRAALASQVARGPRSAVPAAAARAAWRSALAVARG